MTKAILAVAAFLFAGANAVYAQHAGGMASSSANFGGGGFGGGGYASSSGSTVRSKPAPVPGVNVSARNDGPFVPSTYVNYSDAVAEGGKTLNARPLSLGEFSRQVREQKKAEGQKSRILIDQDAYGRIEITPREP
jgi:hypothetical protein